MLSGVLFFVLCAFNWVLVDLFVWVVRVSWSCPRCLHCCWNPGLYSVRCWPCPPWAPPRGWREILVQALWGMCSCERVGWAKAAAATLLRGRVWAIFDVLPSTDTDTYDHLKKALLDGLSPDTEEDRLSARDTLSRSCLCEDIDSIDELARDIEKLLDKGSPGLPPNVRDTELQFHLTSPEKIAIPAESFT